MIWNNLELPSSYYYQDDAVIIYCADCREILPELPDKSVDLVLTDPPYASGARTDANKQVRGSMLRGLEDVEWFSHDAMTNWGFQWFMKSVVAEIRHVLEDGSHVYWFTDWRMTPTVYGMLEAYGYRVNHCLVWAKTHFGMGTYWRNQHENIVFASFGKPHPMVSQNKGTILTFKGISPTKRLHPTEKPLELIKEIMITSGFTTCLDPFMGSGVVTVASKELNRRCIGIEIEERYCEIAAKRCSQSVMKLEV